ncbi:MAG: hypothetical protein FWC97_01550 [Treponema sp.]|nr:hypothetical protein [Treponema sp.]
MIALFLRITLISGTVDKIEAILVDYRTRHMGMSFKEAVSRGNERINGRREKY